MNYQCSFLQTNDYHYFLLNPSFIIHHHHSLVITVIHLSSLIDAVVAIDINICQIFTFCFSNHQDCCWQTSLKPSRAVVTPIHLFIIGVKCFVTLKTFVDVDLNLTIGITIGN